MDHHRCGCVRQPCRRQRETQPQCRAKARLLEPQNKQQQKGQQCGGQKFSVCAPPVDDQQVIRIQRIERGRKQSVRGREPLAGEPVHGRSGKREHNPAIRAGYHLPGQSGTERGAQGPGSGRIKQEASLAVSPVRQRRPARICDAILPLAENFHPRKHVELEIMSGRTASPEKRSDSQQTGASQHQGTRDRGPEQMTFSLL